MLTLADFEARLVASLQDTEIIARYNAGDPLVVQQARANAAYLALLAQEIDVATIEPFIKARDRSILADATNKGILPTATPCQHRLEVINSGSVSISLSQGRVIEDSQGGRPWRLLASITVNPASTAEVLVEQSELREVSYAIPITESFHRVPVAITDGLSLASLTVRDDESIPNVYRLAPRWMNAAPAEYAVTVGTDSLQRIIVEFGDDARVGRTAQLNQVFTFVLTECYGAVDTARLKDATLAELLSREERLVRVRFKSAGLVRAGADPLSIAQLRLLASYPALYDENAVFLGNFDFLARKNFMARSDYLAVWNEVVQERTYAVVSLDDINRLHLAVMAKNSDEQVLIETEISQLLGRADSLYEGRIKVHAVVARPYQLIITGRLAAVHDIDAVAAQIRGLLTSKYGRGTVAASRWMPDGMNSQEVATLLRSTISAFQDRISDFGVSGESLSDQPVKPHEWLYLTDTSITIALSRTADTGGTLWTL